MNRSLKFICLSLLLLAPAACGSKPNPAADGLDCEGDVCSVAIAISAPPAAATTYANKNLPIQVTVTPPDRAPSQIQLRKNGALLASLEPPFAYTWNTTQEQETTYKLQATATIEGRTVSSQEITVVVDRTPPTMETWPSAGDANVALSEPIRITFSEPINPGTVPSTAIVLKDASGASLAARAALGADGRTLTVSSWNRAAVTAFPATITASLAGTVTDLAGNPVAAPASWSWTAPQWVKMPPLPGSQPKLALDTAGQPTISFIRPDATGASTGTGPIGIARGAAGSTWDVRLPPTSSAIFTTALAMDAMNRPVLAWAEQNHVAVARLTGSNWERLGGDADAGLSTSLKGVASIALDADGAPTVGIWDYVSQMGPPSGYLARWNSSAWQLLNGAATPIPTSSGGPLIAIDGAGAPVVWSSLSLQRFADGSWQTFDGAQASYPALALDGQGRPVLAFQTNAGGTTGLEVRELVQGTWLSFSTVASSAGGFGEVNVAVTPDSHPVLLWKQLGGVAPDLHLARHDGQSWSLPYGTVNAVSGGAPAHVQLALDGAGSPVVAFDEYDAATATTSVYVWRSNQ